MSRIIIHVSASAVCAVFGVLAAILAIELIIVLPALTVSILPIVAIGPGALIAFAAAVLTGYYARRAKKRLTERDQAFERSTVRFAVIVATGSALAISANTFLALWGFWYLPLLLPDPPPYSWPAIFVDGMIFLYCADTLCKQITGKTFEEYLPEPKSA